LREWYEKSGFEVDGLKFINCTPHPLNLDDGRTIEGNVECAKILTATSEEKIIDAIGEIKFVTTEFEPSDEGKELAKEAEEEGYILIGSIISAQAYKYPPVVSPIATPETSRLPPQERKVFSRKWNAYQK